MKLLSFGRGFYGKLLTINHHQTIKHFLMSPFVDFNHNIGAYFSL